MRKPGPSTRIALWLGLLGLMIWGGWWLLMDPRSPLPHGWHPLRDLDVAAKPGALTGLHLRRALASDGACLAALQTGAVFQSQPPLMAEGGCGIDPRVTLTRVAGVAVAPLETSCPAALRLALWAEHGVKPSAQDLGAQIVSLRHQGSYNCRPIRGGTRLSTHATGEAVDVAGVTLSDGRRLELLDGWDDPGAVGTFWRSAHASACRWFVTVLGPDFNALHADHFHMQSVGWGSCR
ncbi:MAG: extensin family protein [Pseudomonadota bacterium]